jgi:hypothetical protein
LDDARPSARSSSAPSPSLIACRGLAKDWEDLNRKGLAFLRLAYPPQTQMATIAIAMMASHMLTIRTYGT